MAKEKEDKKKDSEFLDFNKPEDVKKYYEEKAKRAKEKK